MLSGRLRKSIGIEVGSKMLNKKGQNLAEVVILFALVALVFVAMQTYVKRGIQGKTKDLTDRIIGIQQKAYTAETETSSTSTSISGTTTVATGSGGTVYKTVGETTRSLSVSESTSK